MFFIMLNDKLINLWKNFELKSDCCCPDSYDLCNSTLMSLKRSYLEDCTVIECNSSLGLSCDLGVCKCDNDL